MILAGCWLAIGAEVAAPVTDEYSVNRGAAGRAEFTTEAVGNLKVEVGCPSFPTGAKVGICAGTLITDS
ncbi:unnamed protein product [marine sediment metagenome]|uniref:Uncharacterized protein n=1 Tax=marine sediment metagenome TaxID=412755 RepID=X1PCQ9_9ZZZZ